MCCLNHFASNDKLKKHRCSGQVQKDAVTLALVCANSLLTTRDFSVSGQDTEVISSTIFLGKATYSSISSQVGLPQLSNRVEEFIARFGMNERLVKSHTNMSAEAVQYRLAAQDDEGLSEVPFVAQSTCSILEHWLKQETA